MDGNNKIPAPISFNASKHHLKKILDILNRSDEKAVHELESICHNYSDIYTGNLSPREISEKIILFLKELEVCEKNTFTKWLSGKNHHRKIILPDLSEWILRLAKDPDRFIHIHPAKTGPFTIRFKGSTLKTVYRVKRMFEIQKGNPTLKQVNAARKKANLSPVKALNTGKGILKCWKYFSQIG